MEVGRGDPLEGLREAKNPENGMRKSEDSEGHRRSK
jgi:hypothetical protein